MMSKHTGIVFLALLIVGYDFLEIKVFKNTVLHSTMYVNKTQEIDNASLSKGLTICTRVLFHRLNTLLLNSWASYSTFPINLWAEYTMTFLLYGPRAMLVKKLGKGHLRLWMTSRWHSICIVLDLEEPRTQFIIVRYSMY